MILIATEVINELLIRKTKKWEKNQRNGSADHKMELIASKPKTIGSEIADKRDRRSNGEEELSDEDASLN